MKGYVDLHSHYLPAIDDGVRTADEGLELLRRLKKAGFDRVIATPHIRPGMFDNEPDALRAALDAFAPKVGAELPEIGLGAEHFFDDVVWELFASGHAVRYPGGHAALVEFPTRALPVRVEQRFFELQVKGIRPVLAHPERYDPVFKKTDPLDALLDGGALPLLDVMSLVGKYGKHPQRAAERMLGEGVYYAACSDCHRPGDVEHVEAGIARLHRLIGASGAEELLADHPRRILEGTFD
jgi:protein-tyrosine phosphatase